MASIEEIQSKVVEPMRALYRVPFGIEEPERALVEYTKALKAIPGQLLEGAWDRVVATHKRRDWPTISELIMASGYAGAVKANAEIPAAKAATMHPSRVNGSGEMQGYAFYESHLRNDSQWEQFLDAIHPSAEHNFFVQAEKAGDGLDVPSDFRREYINTNYGEALKARFGQRVPITVNPSRKYRALPVSIGAKNDLY